MSGSARPGAPVDLVILDCDGVLVDSEVLAVEIDRAVLAELGWDITTEEVVERFVGKSHASFTAEVAAHLGRPLADDWDAPYLHRYADAFEAHLRPVDGIEDALDRITTPTCVASSGGFPKIHANLARTGLLPRFAGRISSATEVEHGKPAPDLFLLAAARMGVDPARCVVVEDSPYGVQGARAAGMRALGYAGGLTPAHRLRDAGATAFDDMRDLPRLLRELAG
ncbi:HAD family hydrolase [Clavibacter tessellarius]|uniref:Haloacid dehalogenase n=1 Tax=Clavibacter tessellarius TaxID=31965 RepID=A0A225CLL8_9MICO|nr:HAD family hydrolase [Clavibacter michiganensis]OQJ62304.1 haloacid dehalogenase [Clavibacter michiganensis subsp. tessellarius]UKF34696.1 HAD family hydrolase [Clavibacter michiganensis subsp. tessellarius]